MENRYTGIISITTGSLYLCDMRYGPTEDGHAFDVDEGEYLIIHQNDSETGQTSVLVVSKGGSPDREERLPDLSTELNMFGVLDKTALVREFGSIEELFEWGDLEIYLNAQDMLLDVQSPSGNQIHCFRVGDNEGDHAVYSLFQGDKLIGFKVEIRDGEDESVPAKSSSTIFRVELTYREVSLELYLFSEYDRESIDDTIRDCILDHVMDDVSRIQGILTGQEAEIDDDMILGDYDPSLSKLTGFKLYRQIETGDDTLMYECTVSTELPENSIQGIRNAIQTRSCGLLVG